MPASQERDLIQIPALLVEQLPAFTRPAPGIPVKLKGMGLREHALENPGVARFRPLDGDAYQRPFPR